MTAIIQMEAVVSMATMPAMESAEPKSDMKLPIMTRGREVASCCARWRES